MVTCTVSTSTHMVTAPAHGFAERQPVAFTSSGVLPQPLVARDRGAIYYVHQLAGDAFRLAYADGGPLLVEFGDLGSGVHQVEDASPRSALEALYQDVQAYFAARPEIIRFGRAEVTQQANQAATRAQRVVFVPGDDTGKLGVLAHVREPSARAPRAIHRWDELATVHVWGRNATAPRNDEQAHYRACWDLFELVCRALRSSAAARYTLSEPRRVLGPVEASFGYALTFGLQVHGRVVESMPAIARAPLTAEITTSEIVSLTP